MADLVALRARLIALRDDVLRQLAEADHLDGWLLAVLECRGRARCTRRHARVEAADRAIVTDVSGEPIALVLYREDGRIATVELSSIRAVALAARLIGAAQRRLA
jgi:hypothetical protein